MEGLLNLLCCGPRQRRLVLEWVSLLCWLSIIVWEVMMGGGVVESIVLWPTTTSVGA